MGCLSDAKKHINVTFGSLLAIAGLGLCCTVAIPSLSVLSDPTIALASEAAAYADGQYAAEGDGIGGKVPVTVVVEEGKISQVLIGENSETTGIGSHAIDELPDKIVEANGTQGVDGVAGASITSKAILQAVDECIAQAQTGEAPMVVANPVDIDGVLDSMTLDELVALRQNVDDRIAAMQQTAAEETPEGDALTSDYVGSSVEFKGFTITITGAYTVVQDRQGNPVIRVPMTVTNNSGSTDSLNMFYIKYYGSQGTGLDIHYFTFDDELANGADMRSGASIEAAAYLDYDGDGDYYISFDDMWNEPIEFCIPVML